MEDITVADYPHAKTVCQDFEINYLGERHVLYIQSVPLLSAKVFENFQNTCPKIYELHTACFLTKISMESSLKNRPSRIRSIN